MEKCDHIIGLGYANYFNEQDDVFSVITETFEAKMKERFGDKHDLIIERFTFCPSCGEKIGK